METITGIIKGVTKIKEYEGNHQIGFLLENRENWFNIVEDKKVLNELLKLIQKDNEISFNFDPLSLKISNIILRKGSLKETKENDIINIKGKEFMTYNGLLRLAHEKGKFNIVITESWVSDDMKMAWCKVRLTTEECIFDGFGSSTPENTGDLTQSHPVEMAHTRAKGRALRDYLNIGHTMAEELKD